MRYVCNLQHFISIKPDTAWFGPVFYAFPLTRNINQKISRLATWAGPNQLPSFNLSLGLVCIYLYSIQHQNNIWKTYLRWGTTIFDIWIHNCCISVHVVVWKLKYRLMFLVQIVFYSLLGQLNFSDYNFCSWRDHGSLKVWILKDIFSYCMKLQYIEAFPNLNWIKYIYPYTHVCLLVCLSLSQMECNLSWLLKQVSDPLKFKEINFLFYLWYYDLWLKILGGYGNPYIIHPLLCQSDSHNTRLYGRDRNAVKEY